MSDSGHASLWQGAASYIEDACMPSTHWFRPATAALVVLLITCLAVVSPGSAEAPPAGSGASQGLAAGPHLVGPATVTLITGDRVTLVPTRSGRPEVVLEVDPDGGPNDDYTLHREGDRIEVIPHDVAELVPRVLDPDLFDVAGLVAMGYDDARSDTIPLIIRRAPGRRILHLDPALDGAVELPSIRAAAVQFDKERADTFGADLTALASGPGTATRAATAAALGGIDRIWLDAPVHAARAPRAATPLGSSVMEPDEYLTQIGAPEAWATGLDGTGVSVAILDTGIDSGHPDLAGQVRAERNFTDSATTDDVLGHGTHVASLVAGTGAAAQGARQGIAPGARLLNGKVLSDHGDGRLSWLIAGMEWAVAEGADVVNLSVAAHPGEADDPVVQALDTLAVDSGTLFVVAAGNSGWNGWVPHSVSSPGTATSALTVGAVDAEDRSPGFTGQGPTLGSYRTKPDIAAPGVMLLGARAGARDDDVYRESSGTSMATPLVAGAAALVMDQHPDWSWKQVRSAITTSADPLGEPWSTGAGRLALESMVEVRTTVAPSTLSPGAVMHPQESPMRMAVTLTNTGAESRTYSATDAQVAPSDGTVAPEGALVVTPAIVTIRAGETASVEVVFDPAQVRDDYWHGHVEFSGDDGSSLRLPFATYDEPERYWLDVTVLDRNGEPSAGTRARFLNSDLGFMYSEVLDERGQARLRVAPGTYATVNTIHTAEGDASTTTLAGTTSLVVEADTSITIDAREAEQVSPPTIRGGDTEATEFSLAWNITAGDGNGYGDVIAPPIEDVLAGRVFVTPGQAGGAGTVETAVRWRLESKGRRTPQMPDAYELVFVADRLADPTASVLPRREVGRLAEVTEHHYAPAHDAAVLRGLTSVTSMGPGIVHRQELAAPSSETVLMTADDSVLWGYDTYWLDEDQQLLSSPEPLAREPASHVEQHMRRALHVGAWQADHGPWGLGVHQGFTDGTLVGPVGRHLVRSASTALYRDDELVGSSPEVFGWFDVPAERSVYRLVGEVLLHDGRRSQTSWGFSSQAPDDPDAGSFTPPLMTVDYGPSVSARGTAEARAHLNFDLRIGYLAGADADEQVTDARLQWSPDGGETWRDAAVRRTGPARFHAMVKKQQLPGGGSLSVRLQATDGDGNSIDQTVVDLVPVG
jgi:subtilisin family serine protease